jgi:hypothetical protein
MGMFDWLSKVGKFVTRAATGFKRSRYQTHTIRFERPAGMTAEEKSALDKTGQAWRTGDEKKPSSRHIQADQGVGLQEWLRAAEEWIITKKGVPPDFGFVYTPGSSYMRGVKYDVETRKLIVYHVNKNTFAEYSPMEPVTVYELLLGVGMPGRSRGKYMWAHIRRGGYSYRLHHY